MDITVKNGPRLRGRRDPVVWGLHVVAEIGRDRDTVEVLEPGALPQAESAFNDQSCLYLPEGYHVKEWSYRVRGRWDPLSLRSISLQKLAVIGTQFEVLAPGALPQVESALNTNPAYIFQKDITSRMVLGSEDGGIL